MGLENARFKKGITTNAIINLLLERLNSSKYQLAELGHRNKLENSVVQRNRWH